MFRLVRKYMISYFEIRSVGPISLSYEEHNIIFVYPLQRLKTLYKIGSMLYSMLNIRINFP